MASDITNIAVIGNCQSVVIAECLRVMLPDHKVRVGYSRDFRAGKTDLDELLQSSEIVFVQTSMYKWLQANASNFDAIGKLHQYPEIYFSGFHPDLVYAKGQEGNVVSAMASYNSAICLYGWLNDFSTTDVESLYSDRVFKHLGYYNHMEQSKISLLKLATNCGLDLSAAYARWQKRGPFMHSVNHPSLTVLCDLAREMLKHARMTPSVKFPEYYMSDPLILKAVWPIYPQVAQSLGFEGEYIFKLSSGVNPARTSLQTYTLPEFIAESYKCYDGLDKQQIKCVRFDDLRYEDLANFINKSAIRGKSSHSPYSGLPDYQFWKKAVASPAVEDVDPVVNARIKIAPSTRVATAGSCFAQHIARVLKQSGYNYYVTEDGVDLSPAVKNHKNYGVFSARYGNLYTARQLNQLFDRAYNNFTPIDIAWQRDDGRYVDPFRPQIDPDGFATENDIETERHTHLGYVRTMFESLDVFVFTLGLTEAWLSRQDGAVFPLAPGVAGGKMDDEKYVFKNFTAQETYADIKLFLKKLRKINPNCKVILTVSPVPLIATYENRHVLTSTTYSKSALRVAAQQIVDELEWAEYFPSYEIITGAHSRGQYFDDDLRSVKDVGVNHVMGRFLHHYSEGSTSAPSPSAERENDALEHELMQGRSIVCDEELIEESIKN